MTARSFLDSNVLVYADDTRDRRKQRKAIDLVSRTGRARTGVISTQVLQEYFVTTTRKLGTTVERAQRKVEIFGRLDIVRVDLSIILRAIDLHRLHQISFWDALIVSAALASGCTRLLTEDLQHGHRFAGLEVVNPFR